MPFIPHHDLPDALAAYRHFLYCKGADRTFSYERYVASNRIRDKSHWPTRSLIFDAA